MALLISKVFSNSPPIFLVTFPRIYSHTIPAPIPQYVFAFTILVKLTLVFPFFTFAASLHLHFSVYAFTF